MAQERNVEFNELDSSFELGKMFLQALPAGLYYGFDAVLGASMNLTYNHDTTGKSFVLVNGSTTSKKGVIVSNQGVQIYEDAVSSLTITPTSATARRDAIICTHQYVESAGGQAATYSVLPNIGSGVPSLTAYQVLIGILDLPANCTALNQTGVTYTEYRKLNFNTIQELLVGIDSRLDAVENEKYDKEQPDAINVNFEPHWANAFPVGQSNVKYRKEQNGRVTLSGAAIYNSTSGLGTIFNLPLGFRPSPDVVNHRSAIITSSGELKVLNILPNGDVQFSSGSPSVGEVYWFNNISFFTVS
jgi:hypothetical protein